MPTVSTIPTVKARIITLLVARAGLSGVSVTYAWPGTSAAAEQMFFGETQAVDHEIANIRAGRKQRQETYDLGLVIQVLKPGSTALTASTVESRAFALAQEVENMLADDPTLAIGPPSGALQWAHVDSIESPVLVPFEKGWGAELTVRIRCHARLT